jgi:PAS domain-containing protein
MDGRNTEELMAAAAADVSPAQHFDPATFIAPKESGLCDAWMETAAQVIMRWMRRGRVVLANTVFETMLGYQRAEILGRPLETLIFERKP